MELQHTHNPIPFSGCAKCDIEKNEKFFEVLKQELERDCYKELWDIIDYGKVTGKFPITPVVGDD